MLTQETSLIILIVFCLIALPVGFKSMMKKKQEGKQSEYYLFLFSFIVGVLLLGVLLYNAYHRLL